MYIDPKHVCNRSDSGLKFWLFNRNNSFNSKRIEKVTVMQILVDFVKALPPLLQLLLGVFVTLGVFRCLMAIIDFIEDKREGKE